MGTYVVWVLERISESQSGFQPHEVDSRKSIWNSLISKWNSGDQSGISATEAGFKYAYVYFRKSKWISEFLSGFTVLPFQTLLSKKSKIKKSNSEG